MVAMVTLIQNYSFNGDGSEVSLVYYIAMVANLYLVLKPNSFQGSLCLQGFQVSMATTAAP